MSDSKSVWQNFSKFALVSLKIASSNSGVLGAFRARTKLLSHNLSTSETKLAANLQSVSLACKLARFCGPGALLHHARCMTWHVDLRAQ